MRNPVFAFSLIGVLGLSGLLLFQNCGEEFASTIEIEQSFMPYVDSFLAAGMVRGQELSANQLTIQLVEENLFSEDAEGYCFQQPGFGSSGQIIGTRPTVTIKRSWWEQAEDYRKLDLIYHELGHCLLQRSHKTGVQTYILSAEGVTQEETAPSSIMDPKLPSSYLSRELFEANWEDLLDELFQIQAGSLKTLKAGLESLSPLAKVSLNSDFEPRKP